MFSAKTRATMASSYVLNRQKIADEIVAAIKERCVRDEETGCLLWQGYVNKDGYGVIGWLGAIWYANRVIAFKGDLLNYQINRGDTLHSCDTPACCEETHLSVGTHTENMHDADRKGRLTKSYEAARRKRKLTNLQALEVKLLLQRGLNQLEVSRVLGISRNAVYHMWLVKAIRMSLLLIPRS